MLKRFYTAVVHRRRAVLAAFVLAAVLSVFASRAVQVDYDINDYLPPDSPSTPCTGADEQRLYRRHPQHAGHGAGRHGARGTGLQRKT